MIVVEEKLYPIGIKKKEVIVEMSQRGPTGRRGPKGEKGDPGTTTWEGIVNKPTLGALADHDTIDYLTEIINKPLLGALADHDTIDYLTEIINKPDLGTMSDKDDAASDDYEYIRRNGAWEKLIDAPAWDTVGGILEDLIEIDAELNLKSSIDHVHGNVGTNGEMTGGSFIVMNGDRLVISDASRNNKLGAANLIFDGSTIHKALTQKGSFESFVIPTMIAHSENEMVATNNYVAGNLIGVQGILYVAMTNIAAGSELIIGTNVDITTLEEQIAANRPIDSYTKQETNELLALKADLSHNHDSRYYTETEVNSRLSEKSPITHRHATTDITTGIFTVARGGTGVASTSPYYVFAGPSSAATAAGAPSFRRLVASDIPSIPATKIGSGVLPVSYGGTGASSVSPHRVFAGPSGSSAGSPNFRPLVADDIPSIPGAKINSAINASCIPDISAAKITSGYLLASRGGTGTSSASPNKFFAGPSSGTQSNTPYFRSIVSDDLPNLNVSKITTGELAVERGGTGVGTTSRGYVFAGPVVDDTAAPGFRALVDGDIPSLDASKIMSGTLPVSRGGTGQNQLDSTPQSGSNRLVKSSGIYSALAAKANVSHTHDNRYYTEAETDSLLADKADADDVYTKTEADALLANKANAADLGDLAEKDKVDWDTDIDDIPNTFPPESHTHTMSDVTDLPTFGDLAEKDKVDWDTDIDDIPQTFPPEAHNHDDRYYTETESDALLDEKLDAHSTTDTGAVVTFNAENTSAIKGLTVGIEPVQDLHGYDHPWPAGGGANIMPMIKKGTYTGNGITVVVGDDNLITVSGTKDTDSEVTIPLPYETSGQIGYLNYRIHCRNTSVNSNMRIYWATPSAGYQALSGVNKISNANGTEREFETAAIYFGTGITSGTEVSMVLQPSFELSDSVTDWTPYSNVCPISGHTQAVVTRTGKNLLLNNKDVVSSSGVTYTKNQDSSITINGSVDGNSYYNLDFTGTDPNDAVYDISGLAGKTVTFTLTDTPISGLRANCSCYHKDGTSGYMGGGYFSQSNTFEIPDDAWKSRTYLQVKNTTLDNVTIYPQLELGSVATAYEAPQIQTVTIDLGGTRYGGTLDVYNGTLIVTHEKIVMDGVTSGKMVSAQDTGKNYYFNLSTANTTGRTTSGWYGLSELQALGMMCNALPLAEYDANNITTPIFTAYLGDAGYLQPRFIFPSDGPIQSQADCNQWFADMLTAETPVEFVYKLATPLTVQLTPAQLSTLLGENHIWADTGDSTVTHLQVTGDLAYQDTVDYETQVTNKPDYASMISGVESAMLATKNYSEGDLVSVGDQLYRATAAIASGESIVVGTNVIATTVEEVIKSYHEDTGWVSFTNTTNVSGTIYYRLIGGSIVCVRATNITLKSNLAADSSIELGRLPAAARPSYTIYGGAAFINDDTVNDRVVTLNIGNTGRVYIRTNKEPITTSMGLYVGIMGMI